MGSSKPDNRLSRLRRSGAPKSWKHLLLVVLAGAAALLYEYFGESEQAALAPPQPASLSAPAAEVLGDVRGGEWVAVAGRVQRTLSDDNEGSRHQRFILELSDGRTLLVAHNIDLAERVPLQRGDTVSMYGRFEENDRGGVIHWTHHDPQGRHDGGWIEYRGTRYR